jgi:amino-acid N-acetyltransferase
MKVRKAQISDVEAIYSLINWHAERDRMLFRSKADIFENLQSFMVAEVGNSVVGCCILQVIWSDLAEVRSLAVEEKRIGTGIGKMLVEAVVSQARALGVPRIFALTLNPEFFERSGFEEVARHTLPMKVWSDCAKCPKRQNCDEIAVVKNMADKL